MYSSTFSGRGLQARVPAALLGNASEGAVGLRPAPLGRPGVTVRKCTPVPVTHRKHRGSALRPPEAREAAGQVPPPAPHRARPEDGARRRGPRSARPPRRPGPEEPLRGACRQAGPGQRHRQPAPWRARRALLLPGRPRAPGPAPRGGPRRPGARPGARPPGGPSGPGRALQGPGAAPHRPGAPAHRGDLREAAAPARPGLLRPADGSRGPPGGHHRRLLQHLLHLPLPRAVPPARTADEDHGGVGREPAVRGHPAEAGPVPQDVRRVRQELRPGSGAGERLEPALTPLPGRGAGHPEAGGVREPDAAAPHAGARAEGAPLRAAAQGLPEAAAGRRPGPAGRREVLGTHLHGRQPLQRRHPQNGENAPAPGSVRAAGRGGGRGEPGHRAGQGGPHPEAVRQDGRRPGSPPLPVQQLGPLLRAQTAAPGPEVQCPGEDGHFRPPGAGLQPAAGRPHVHALGKEPGPGAACPDGRGEERMDSGHRGHHLEAQTEQPDLQGLQQRLQPGRGPPPDSRGPYNERQLPGACGGHRRHRGCRRGE